MPPILPLFIERYKCTVGYSGHEYGLTPTVFAVSLGAKIIERHITVDHKMWGTDQAMSLEPRGMQIMISTIKNFELALGRNDKEILQDEKITLSRTVGRE